MILKWFVIMGIFINNISQRFIVCFVKETLQGAWSELNFALQILAKTSFHFANKGD